MKNVKFKMIKNSFFGNCFRYKNEMLKRVQKHENNRLVFGFCHPELVSGSQLFLCILRFSICNGLLRTGVQT